jgi:hypothetical protein
MMPFDWKQTCEASIDSDPFIPMTRTVKAVVVGEGAIAKTFLLWSYVKQETPPDCIGRIVEHYNVDLKAN